MRDLIVKMNASLNPDNSSVCEPATMSTSRGRPRLHESVRRDRSARDKGARRNAASGKSSKRSLQFEEVGGDSESSPLIPSYVHPFCNGITDVESDGNCGFRAVALGLYGNQNEWETVRTASIGEILMHRDIYSQVLHACLPHTLPQDTDSIAWAIGRLNHFSSPCPFNGWMSTPTDLFAIATYANALVIHLSINRGCCFSVLPLRSLRGVGRPSRQIAIAHVHGMHFVHVSLTDDCPVPPLAYLWRYHCDDVMASFAENEEFKKRLDHWDAICGP